MSFQDRVNQDVPSGFAGDFATSNPRIVLGGGNIVFRAGKGGVLASSFVWRDTNSNFVINQGTTTPVGFIMRQRTGIMPNYLQENSMIIPEGFEVTVFAKGDFIVMLPEDMAPPASGDIVYASKTTGQIVPSTDANAVATGYHYGLFGENSFFITGWV